MTDDAMSLRALGRATLARQMLLAREKVTPVAAIERLAGVQAQLGRPAFVALWTRVEGFAAEALRTQIAKRKVVRATLMRATLHMVSARDYRMIRPALAPMLIGAMKKVLGARASSIDPDALERAARDALGGGAMTFEELRPRLAKAMKHGDERALGYAVRVMLPLVQASDGAPWGWGTGGSFALAESYLDTKIEHTTEPDALVLRYLAALGPATPQDAQVWSGLPRLREVFDRLRPKLRVFRDAKGRELFDLPRAPRPDQDTPAPVRFLPDWDNLILSHADRTRVIDDAHRKLISTGNLGLLSTFTVDGRVAGRWRAAREKRRAILSIDPFVKLAKKELRDVEREGAALLAFLEPELEDHDVRVQRKV
jgi:hypothetical protein